MKTKFSLVVLAAMVAMLFLFTMPDARAAAGVESFNVTNRITAQVTSTVGWPTNSSGLFTGGAINLDNYTTVGLCVQGSNTIGGVTNIGNTTSNFIAVALVRSAASSPPLNWQWEGTPFITFKIPVNGLSNIYYVTNIEAGLIGPGRWLGIYSISNTCSSGDFTNGQGQPIVSVVKKIIPIAYP